MYVIAKVAGGAFTLHQIKDLEEVLCPYTGARFPLQYRIMICVPHSHQRPGFCPALHPTHSLARRSIQQMARAAAPSQDPPPRLIPPLSSPSALPTCIYEPSAPLPASIIKPSYIAHN